MSDLLAQFYQDYWDAVNRKIKPSWYSDACGLCHNLQEWATDNGIYGDDAHDLSLELEEQFDDAGLNTEYPFNGDWDSYSEERDKGAMTRNPKRRAWVRGKLKEIENDSK